MDDAPAEGGDDPDRDRDGHGDRVDRDPGGDAPDGPRDGAGGPGRPGDEDHQEEWRFGVDEVGEDGIVRPTIEPGDPKPEHVLFVALGILAMLLVIARIWMLL